jgi:alkylation response protein AidB-like acyl-CoA dehydrogenase
MDLALSDEQEALRASARAFLDRACPPEVVRRLRTPEGTGHDARLWKEMVALGWPGLALPEAVGGGGGDLVDLAVVFEEAGRALAPTTLYSTVVAALLLCRAGDDAQREALLTPVLQGERLTSIALHEQGMRFSPDAIATTTEARGDGHVAVRGLKLYVPNAAVADELVVVARSERAGRGAVRLVVVPTDAPGVRVEPQATFAHDAQHVVAFDDVVVAEDRVLAVPDGAWETTARTVRDATALQCVEMVGGAARVLDMTVEYVALRAQFGRPIGSFQAVQHHVADLSIAVDAARLAAWQAVWRCATGEDADREVAVAKVAANRAYVDATLVAHQLHGAIGFVVDHDLHLWSDRARATAQTFGTTDDHLRALGRRLVAATGRA